MRNNKIITRQIAINISIIAGLCLAFYVAFLLHNLTPHKAIAAEPQLKQSSTSSPIVTDDIPHAESSPKITPQQIIQDRLNQTLTYYQRQKEILQGELEQTRSYFRQQERKLAPQRNNPEEYRKSIATLQAEFDRAYNEYNDKIAVLQTKIDNANLEHKTLLGELERIQSLIDAEMIRQEKGQRAMWKMVLPEEAYRAMYPEN